jgi:hypothetical protein
MNKEMIQLEMYVSEYKDSKRVAVNKIYDDLKQYCKTYGQLTREVKKYGKHLRWMSLDALAKALVEKHEAELNNIPLNTHIAAFNITSPLHAEALVINIIGEIQYLNKLKKNVTEGNHQNAEAKKDI